VTLRETIFIPAPAEQVWAAVAQPEMWSQWNSHVSDMRRSHRGPVSVGEQIDAVFTLNDRRSPSQVEIVVCEPPHRLVLKQHSEYRERIRSITVAFDIETRVDGVQFTQTMDLAESGTPWLLQLLVWWVHRFGRPVGSSTLEQLRDVVAAGANQADMKELSQRAVG